MPCFHAAGCAYCSSLPGQAHPPTTYLPALQRNTGTTCRWMVSLLFLPFFPLRRVVVSRQDICPQRCTQLPAGPSVWSWRLYQLARSAIVSKGPHLSGRDHARYWPGTRPVAFTACPLFLSYLHTVHFSVRKELMSWHCRSNQKGENGELHPPKKNAKHAVEARQDKQASAKLGRLSTPRTVVLLGKSLALQVQTVVACLAASGLVSGFQCRIDFATTSCH